MVPRPTGSGIQVKTILAVLAVLSVWALGSGASFGTDLILTDARIYPSPTEPPIEHGSILVHDSHVVAVGPAGSIRAPREVVKIDCRNLFVTAGFWNSTRRRTLLRSPTCVTLFAREESSIRSRDSG